MLGIFGLSAVMTGRGDRSVRFSESSATSARKAPHANDDLPSIWKSTLPKQSGFSVHAIAAIQFTSARSCILLIKQSTHHLRTADALIQMVDVEDHMR